MTNGPPATPDAPPLWQMWRDLAEAQARTSQSVADQGARLAAVERSLPELASRLDGRFSAMEGQQARTQEHLGQQDQAQALFAQKVTSQLGALQGVEQKRAEAQAAADERASTRHEQSASRVRQTVAGIAGFTAAQVAAELAGWPLRWRLLALAAGAVLALGWVLLDYIRTRPQRRTP